MGLFRKRNDRVIDLSEKYRRQQERAEEIRQDMQKPESLSDDNTRGFGFFGAIANTVSQNNSTKNSEYIDVSSGAEEKRRKLAKRLMEMTNKIEELSNQIYHLQQRIEVLEKKGGVGERFRGSE